MMYAVRPPYTMMAAHPMMQAPPQYMYPSGPGSPGARRITERHVTLSKLGEGNHARTALPTGCQTRVFSSALASQRSCDLWTCCIKACSDRATEAVL